MDARAGVRHRQIGAGLPPVVTGDASHRQGGAARLIQERGGDWLSTLRPTSRFSIWGSWPGSPTHRLGPSLCTRPRMPTISAPGCAARLSILGIENSLHRVLDLGLDENHVKTNAITGPKPPTLRKLALNMLWSARPGLSIPSKRNRSEWFDKLARSVLCPSDSFGTRLGAA